MTTCPQCSLPREPHQFLAHKGKTSKWCDLCREAYALKLRSLGLARTPTTKPRAKTPIEALLDLARQSGAAKHKAMTTRDLIQRKAWHLHYMLERKIERKIERMKERTA